MVIFHSYVKLPEGNPLVLFYLKHPVDQADALPIL